MSRFEKEIQDPVNVEGLPLFYGLNLKRPGILGEEAAGRGDCKVARPDLSALGGLKGFRGKSRRPRGS